ncbi:MAG TPA: hypothetical protein VHU84_18130, partial [Lacipirellulaceae bacterium]|jgi:hypothetical protein|nr:hypothetical protein [Lacipirellulaceae bacterium]
VSKPLINVINTTTHQITDQLIPPASVTQIYNFGLGAGLSGPKSRVYVSTNSGLLAYDELSQFLGFDPSTSEPIFREGFQPAAIPTLPISLSSSASFDIGPDGLLYVLDGAGSASSIKRYNPTTGTFADTFLTFAQYNYGGLVGTNLKFGSDGGLYFSSKYVGTPSVHTFITRFDTGTNQRTDFDLGAHIITDFYVMTVPEPSSALLMLLGIAFFPRQRAIC